MPYTALTSLAAPGTLVYGYQRGHEVPDSVVESWGLVLGQDVTDGPLDDAAPETALPERPTEADNRATWESWAVANGMDPDDAAAASQEDLEAAGPQATEPEAADHPRPADSAKKAEWVLYVNDHPQATPEDQAWAGDDSTTKAELMMWEPAVKQSPEVGDPAAASANERANG